MKIEITACQLLSPPTVEIGKRIEIKRDDAKDDDGLSVVRV